MAGIGDVFNHLLCLLVYRLFHQHVLQPPVTHRQWAGGEGSNRSEESCSEETSSWTGYPHGTGTHRLCVEAVASAVMNQDYWGSPLTSCFSSGDTRRNDLPDKDPLQGAVRRCVGRAWDWLHPLHAEGNAVVSVGFRPNPSPSTWPNFSILSAVM